MTKKTLYLEETTVEALHELASTGGLSEADVIREALTLYRTARSRSLPKGTGAYRSGRTDVSSSAEALLREAARKRR